MATSETSRFSGLGDARCRIVLQFLVEDGTVCDGSYGCHEVTSEDGSSQTRVLGTQVRKHEGQMNLLRSNMSGRGQ